MTRWVPWYTHDYPMGKALKFLNATGFKLHFRGVVWPVGRWSGPVIGWMWREPVEPPEAGRAATTERTE